MLLPDEAVFPSCIALEEPCNSHLLLLLILLTLWRRKMQIYLQKSIVLTVLCGACLAFSFVTAEDKSGTSEWIDLLPQENLAEKCTTSGNWLLSKGVATLKPRDGEKGWTRYDSYLWLQGEYADFEIEFEYSVEKGSNSGFYFHVGDKKEPVKTGVEVQIYDSFGKPANKLNDHDSGGVIPGVAPKKNTAKAPGEWNKFHITSKGDKLTVVLNGEVVNEVDLASGGLKSRPKTGAIGFQDHALPLSLRNIRIRKL
jgi:Domain of Unknown Function (DUF1080)